MRINFFIVLLTLVAANCFGQKETKNGGEKMELVITSAAFEEGGFIPQKYTCDSSNVSPPLQWSGVPGDSKSIALICDDPDAPMGTWVHWVIYNIPPDINSLPENVPADKTLETGAMQGTNDFRKIGYGGPCPPGGTHSYFFKIYALDKLLELNPGLTKNDLLNAMGGHILEEAKLMGKYSR
jgi:Raf kinase inhibitor-like YbhB/YbcL family protein